MKIEADKVQLWDTKVQFWDIRSSSRTHKVETTGQFWDIKFSSGAKGPFGTKGPVDDDRSSLGTKSSITPVPDERPGQIVLILSYTTCTCTHPPPGRFPLKKKMSSLTYLKVIWMNWRSRHGLLLRHRLCPLTNIVNIPLLLLRTHIHNPKKKLNVDVHVLSRQPHKEVQL